ncbi:MAG: YHS domain protein [Paracoccaceae bacterium]|nr:MAG: YHS domain protein [Paracoccaceae bacterium]
MLAFAGLGAALPGAARASRAAVFARPDGVAIGGFDPVGYLTQGRPLRGKAEFSHDWMGATWRFATAAHRDRFAADPAANAPQFGGWCAWGVAEGYLASTDPEAFTVHQGQLYLNYSRGVRSRWERDIPGNIARGRANWPGVLG